MKQYDSFKLLSQKIADIGYAMAVLGWDQEVNMPEEGAPFRGRQQATLAGIAHELFTSSEMENSLQQLQQETSLAAIEAKNVNLTRKDFEKSKKFSSEFVQNKSRIVSESFVAWDRAKRAADFSIFQPHLEKIVEVTKQETDILGYEDHPYNALIDSYEPGMTVKELDALFIDVRAGLLPLLQKINAKQSPDSSFLRNFYGKDDQMKLANALAEKLGYRFSAGRQDISSHPFCTHFNPQDVRITTRINEHELAGAVWSTIHEVGHALYEQGLPTAQYGLPCGSAISLGIHESQSRLWENCIGRSADFVKGFLPLFKNHFPDQLNAISEETFYKGINAVSPTFIRTESDELTYHFHIMIRYEIEKDLVSGVLSVKDVKEAWNEKYKTYLGLTVTDDAKGVLQDVHWSHGGIGYFPTYSLGSFYAAQWYQKANDEMPNLKSEIAQGKTDNLLQWLRTNIHQHGKFYTAEELCTKVTGEKLNFKYFMNYAEKKFGEIYNL